MRSALRPRERGAVPEGLCLSHVTTEAQRTFVSEILARKSLIRMVEAGSKIPLQALSCIGFIDQAETSYPDSYPLLRTLRHFLAGMIRFPFVGISQAY